MSTYIPPPAEQEPTKRKTEVHTNQDNEYGPYDQKLPTGRLAIFNPAGNFLTRFHSYAISAERILYLPDVDDDARLAYRDKTTGLITTDQLATGTPDGTKFLRDDHVWAVPSGGGGGGGGSGIQVREESSAVTAASRSFLNFLEGEDFILADDSVDDEVEVTINRNAANGIAGLDSSGDLAKTEQHPQTAYLDAAQTWGAYKQTFSPAGANVGLNIGSIAGDPSGPANGDVWYNSMTGKFRARQAGVSINVDAGDDLGNHTATTDLNMNSHDIASAVNIKNTGYQEITESADPGAPAATKARLYVEQVDSNNQALYTYIKKNGSYQKVYIA
jgi:hypothetical protein